MKTLFTLLLTGLLAIASFAQNEQAPITEKSLAYKDWTYKTLNGDKEFNLRKEIAGKKLVMVVYWAPWCPNWKYDAPFVQSLYEKYKGSGLEVIGVGEYDTIDKMKAHIKTMNLTFPMVYESTSLADREKTTHFIQRREAGDARKWGSPWYVFLEPTKLQGSGDILTNKVQLVNGELIKQDAEKFIRERLGSDGNAAGTVSANSKGIDACEPGGKTALFKP